MFSNWHGGPSLSPPTHKLFGLRKKAAQSALFFLLSSEFTSCLCLISFANCWPSSGLRRLDVGFERRWSCWIYNHIWYWLFSINSDIPELTCCLRARQRKWSQQWERNGERGGCCIKMELKEEGLMVEYAGFQRPIFFLPSPAETLDANCKQCGVVDWWHLWSVWYAVSKQKD